MCLLLHLSSEATASSSCDRTRTHAPEPNKGNLKNIRCHCNSPIKTAAELNTSGGLLLPRQIFSVSNSLASRSVSWCENVPLLRSLQSPSRLPISTPHAAHPWAVKTNPHAANFQVADTCEWRTKHRKGCSILSLPERIGGPIGVLLEEIDLKKKKKKNLVDD